MALGKGRIMVERARTPNFLLVGNHLYDNRGCEAIVRGTMTILRAEFGEDVVVDNACFGDPELCLRQADNESDAGIRRTYPLSLPRRFLTRCVHAVKYRSLLYLPRPLASLMRPPRSYKAVGRSLETARAALEIGGDNYTLNYCVPAAFVELDRYIQSKNVPVVLWGASVGPFDGRPRLAKRMFDHLRTLSAILVRETLTQEYLDANGVGENVHLVADPAFVMRPQEPPSSRLPVGITPSAIGLNLSPLFGRYVCPGDSSKWLSMCTELVVELIRRTGRQVVLIPHCIAPYTYWNDAAFLKSVACSVQDRGVEQVVLVTSDLTAAETKWVIGRCAVFAGARMHATIAALSVCIPTLSFAYSLKAKGLTRDVLGSLEYCVDARRFNPGTVVERIQSLLSERAAVQELLRRRINEIVERAMSAGRILRGVLTYATNARGSGRQLVS